MVLPSSVLLLTTYCQHSRLSLPQICFPDSVDEITSTSHANTVLLIKLFCFAYRLAGNFAQATKHWHHMEVPSQAIRRTY